MYRTFLHGLALIGMLAFPLVGAEAPKLPSKAQEVMNKLEKSEAKLTNEYNKSVNAERAKSIAELQKAQKDVTKIGDLDGALAIKQQIEDLQAKIAENDDTDLLGSKSKMDYTKAFIGTWAWNKSNGMAGSMEAFADGRLIAKVTAPNHNPFVPGRWELREGKIVLTWRYELMQVETLSLTSPTKLSGDTTDLGKKSFNATKQPSAE